MRNGEIKERGGGIHGSACVSEGAIKLCVMRARMESCQRILCGPAGVVTATPCEGKWQAEILAGLNGNWY